MQSLPRSLLRLRSTFPLLRAGSVRYRSSLPMNTVIIFVPQQEAWVVERMGRFHQICEPGLNFLIPVVDRVKYVQSLKEIAIDIPKQSAVTSDNVTLAIDGVLYLRVVDPYKASYGVEDPEFAITQLAQTTMRSEIGKITLDNVFKERETLNVAIVEAINKAGMAWGITCLRYEIRDIKLPERVQEAMQMQVEAERKKRAVVLESEGRRIEQINRAQGEAAAIQSVASAKAAALERISKALAHKGTDAAALIVAEQYIKAFAELARKNNTLILPADAGNVGSMVAQTMAIYKNISEKQFHSTETTSTKKEEKDNFLADYISDLDENEEDGKP